MAEDPSSRRPPRDARLDELLAASSKLARGQEALRGELRQAEVRRAREAPRFQEPQRQAPRQPVREEPAVQPQDQVRQARATESRLASEREVAAQSRRTAIANANNAAAEARKAEGALKAAQTRLANLRKGQFGVTEYPYSFRVRHPEGGEPFGPRYTSRERAQAAADARSATSGVTPQKITRAETSVASASEKARVARQEAEAAQEVAQAASYQERAVRAAAKEAQAAAVAAETEAAARERSARAARQTAAPTRGATEEGAVARTRQDVENELRATQRKFDQYKNQLYEQGKLPTRRSSTVRDFEDRLGALRQERAGFAAPQPPEAELRKRLDLLRQGKSLTGELTAADVKQLQVTRENVRAVQELRSAQEAPVLGPAAPNAAERNLQARSAQIGLEQRLANLDKLRRDAESSRQPTPAIIPSAGYVPPTKFGQAAEAERQQRLDTEAKVFAAREKGLQAFFDREQKIAADRQAAELKIASEREAAELKIARQRAAATGARNEKLAAELNAAKIPPAGLRPVEEPGQIPRGGVLQVGQPAGDRSGAGSVIRRGFNAPVSGFAGLEGGGVVQTYKAGTDQAILAANAADRAKRNLPGFYQELQRGSVIQAQASQQMRRHGALTTEFLSALARGETTLAEFRFQIGSTIAKFGGWTIAAASVYGVIGAISTLSRGAKESLSGVQQLNRFITNVDTRAAAKGFRDVSREVNVSIGDVANGQANFLRVYHDQGQALEASRTALKLTKLDNVSTADSLRYLTASAQEFQLPASKIVVLGDKLANVFRTMGVPIQESLPAFARSAAAVKNAGGDLTQLIELIAIARRRTGQTGNVIGNAIARSASNFVNRPSSVSVFKQFGLDPNQATTDYTKFVLNAIRKAKDLSGPEIRDLAAALGGPQLGSRIFVGLLRGYSLLPQAAKSAGKESAGVLDKELAVKLAQVDEQISKVGHSLERLGSGLASAGAFAPLGLALKTLNEILAVANDLTGAFAQLPGPVKGITVALGEAYLALKLLRRTGLGGGLAERTGLGYLGYSPQEQLRRGTIITQRNVAQGFANEAEQLGNRYQVATSGSVEAARAAEVSRKEEVRLAGVANVDQKLVAEARARTLAFEEQSRTLSGEALALSGQIEVNARLQAETDARLVGLQKKRLLSSQVAEQQGGAVVVAGPKGPRVVTTDEAKAIESGKAPFVAQTQKVGVANEKVGAEATKGAAVATATTEAAAAATAETAAAAAALDGEAVALEAQAVENAGLGASFARLGRSAAGAAAGAKATFAESSAVALRGLGALVFDPLVLALVAFETLPRIYNSGVEKLKKQQERAAQLARDPQSRSDLQDILDSARKTVKDDVGVAPGGVGAKTSKPVREFPTGRFLPRGDEENIAAKTLATEQRLAAAQAKARAAGKPVPLRFVQGITSDFDRAIEQYRQGATTQRQLQAAYAKAQTELEHSRQATSGTTEGAKAVAVAQKKFGLAIAESAKGAAAIVASLRGQTLNQIAQALSDEADQIAVFGPQPGDTTRISVQLAEATSRVAQDPTPKNLKAYSAARSAVDKTLQDAQTQLQQALAVATTGSQRNTAYTQYFKTIDAESGVDRIRAKVGEARARAAKAAQDLQKAQLAPPAIQASPFKGNVFGAFARQDAAAQIGGPDSAAARKVLEAQRENIEKLRQNFGKNSAEVRRLTALYKRAKLALDAMEQEARTQEAQSQNQVAELEAQVRAGRAGNANEAIIIQLRAAHKALQNDIKHQVSDEQKLQDHLKIQQLQDQQLQTAIQQIQNKTALATSRIDPVNTGAVDRSNLSGLYSELKKARSARPSPGRTDQINQLQTQINSARFQQAQNVRQQAQSENDAYYAYLEAGNATLHPLRVAQLEYQKALNDLKYAHGRAARLQALANIKTARQAVADAVRQNALDESDAYYAYREAGQGTLHPVLVARLEYQKALHALRFARTKIERLQALAEIKNAQENLAEAVHQNAVDEITAYFGLAESKTTDPLRIAQLEYHKAQRLQKQARGPKEQQQTAIDKNNALKNLYQTQADERLKTIEFEASIDKITSSQEISALKRLLKLKHLTKDFRRQILTQIHGLENQDSSSVELNVGNIRLPTLYDVRRLAAQGASNQPPPQHQYGGGSLEFHQTIHNHNTIASTADADAVGARLEHHSRTALASAVRKLGNRRR